MPLLASGSCLPRDLLEASPSVLNLLPHLLMLLNARLLASEVLWDLNGRCGLLSVSCWDLSRLLRFTPCK